MMNSSNNILTLFKKGFEQSAILTGKKTTLQTEQLAPNGTHYIPIPGASKSQLYHEVFTN